MTEDKQLREYLLGRNHAAISARLNADEDLRSRLEIVESELVDEYALGQLGAADRTAFETHYLVTPSRHEKVRLSRSIFRSARRERFGRLALLLTAFVAVAALTYWWERRNTNPGPGQTVISLTANAQRGADAATVDLAKAGDVVRLELHLSGLPAGPLVIRVQAIGMDDGAVADFRLARVTRRMVVIPLPTAALIPGDYAVTAASGAELRDEFILQVQR